MTEEVPEGFNAQAFFDDYMFNGEPSSAWSATFTLSLAHHFNDRICLPERVPTLGQSTNSIARSPAGATESLTRQVDLLRKTDCRQQRSARRIPREEIRVCQALEQRRYNNPACREGPLQSFWILWTLNSKRNKIIQDGCCWLQIHHRWSSSCSTPGIDRRVRT